MSQVLQALNPAQATRVGQAFRLLQADKATEALDLARAVVTEAPNAPDARHVLALCLAATGAESLADEAFRRTLALAPGHPMVTGNYAKFLHKRGLAALKRRESAGAVAALARAVELRPDAASTWQALGSARRAADDLAGAETAFRRSVTLAPGNGAGWVNLGVVLRLLGRPAEALPCLEAARKAGLSGPELVNAEAGVRVDLGEFEAALSGARRLVRDYPLYAAGQVMLVHLLWEHGAALAPDEHSFDAIRAAVTAHPDNQPLQLAYVGLLLETQQSEEALERLRVLRGQEDHPLLVALEANAHEMQGRSNEAGILFAQAHRSLGSSDPSFLNAYTRHLLKAGKWDAAAARATEATRINPDDQEAWGYLGTAWRLLDDPREFWLCDYERLIDLVEVPPPHGFSSHAEFMPCLEATLDPLHKARREPIHQSLRGGSQTPGKLFGRPDPVIRATQAALLQAIEGRLASAELSADPEHPFLRRLARSVRFAGSWSVKLWSSGRHVNHIHTEGWMSSAFYVSLPPAVREKADPDDTAGYIQFGQPPVELGLDLPPRRVIRPRVGYLALFPSYMWHGTIPFEDEAPRITVAFDMTPLD